MRILTFLIPLLISLGISTPSFAQDEAKGTLPPEDTAADSAQIENDQSTEDSGKKIDLILFKYVDNDKKKEFSILPFFTHVVNKEKNESSLLLIPLLTMWKDATSLSKEDMPEKLHDFDAGGDYDSFFSLPILTSDEKYTTEAEYMHSTAIMFPLLMSRKSHLRPEKKKPDEEMWMFPPLIIRNLTKTRYSPDSGNKLSSDNSFWGPLFLFGSSKSLQYDENGQATTMKSGHWLVPLYWYSRNGDSKEFYSPLLDPIALWFLMDLIASLIN